MRKSLVRFFRCPNERTTFEVPSYVFFSLSMILQGTYDKTLIKIVEISAKNVYLILKLKVFDDKFEFYLLILSRIRNIALAPCTASN